MNQSKLFLQVAAAILLVIPLMVARPPFVQKSPQRQDSPDQHPQSACPKLYAHLDFSKFKWVDKRIHHVISASLKGGPATRKLTYKWAITPGTITNGQGGPSITVEMPECICDFSVKVEVEGLDAGCAKEASFSIVDLCFYPIGIYHYGETSEDEKSLLQQFGVRLQKEPCSRMEIVAYHGGSGQSRESVARAERAKKYMVDTYGVERGRIKIVDGGVEEEQKVEIYLLPWGSSREGLQRP